MSRIVEVKIKGFEELNRKLKNLEYKEGKKAFTQAARESIKPIASALKSRLPKGPTGVLKKSPKVRALKRSRKAFGVRVMTHGFYWAFWELGHTRHGRKYPGRRVIINTVKGMKSRTLALFKHSLGKKIIELGKK